MKKKTIGILLMISLVMIMSVSAISAADANDTLQEQVSDTDIEMTSIAYEQEDNSTPVYQSESVNDVEEISASDTQYEVSKQKEVKAASNAKGEVLSASNDDVLKADTDCFYWVEGDKWYEDLMTAMNAIASSDSTVGTIKVSAGTYTEDDDPTSDGDIEIDFDKKATITIQPFEGDQVIFSGEKINTYLYIVGSNAKLTFNHISFTKGKASYDGGAFEVKGQLTLNYCILTDNYADRYGGAVSVFEGGTFIANNCQFTNNKAKSTGGAISCEKTGSVELNNCYFEGNKVGDDENDFGYEHGSDNPGSWEFNDCRFKGHGSLDIDVEGVTKSVTISPAVEDDVNYAVLYLNGEENKRLLCDNLNPATFKDLDAGTYTVYMMKEWEKRYSYPGNTFTIVEPNFVLTIGENITVFETLKDAVNAIPFGGTGEIAVEEGTWTGSNNFNVDIVNKIVTISPKLDITGLAEDVIFSSDSQNYLFSVGSNGELHMEDITVIGKFIYAALKFNTTAECTITDCIFNNTVNSENEPGTPINAENSNLGLYECIFESNGQSLFKNTIANIYDCTFDSNSGSQGGAINADSSSYLNITDSEFTTNVATGEGGAIYASNLEVHDTLFMGNIAEIGGAIYITNLTDRLINITSCVFDTNVATTYRNIYSESLTRKINLEYNEYDLNLTINVKDSVYGVEYIFDGIFDWGSNLNNNYTLLSGLLDDDIIGDVVTIEDNKFNMSMGLLSGGTHEIEMSGSDKQQDSADHFYLHNYYSDINGNEFYLDNYPYAKIFIERAKIIMKLEVKDVLIPEIPVLNVYANWDKTFTIFIGNTQYQVEVVNGKGSVQLTGLDLGNYTVLGMSGSDENFTLALNFTTFSVSKTYSNFVVVSTNAEYDTLKEAIENSNDGDTIFIKTGTYSETGIVISNKTLDLIGLEGAVFDAQGHDGNFIIVQETAEVTIYGITFKGIRNRNTNYGAIVNHGYLTVNSCNFTDNKITKTTFAENGGAAIFSDGELLEIDNCNFINNVAPLKASTAAVTSLGYEDVSITSSRFINNTAREGGALHFKNLIQFESAVASCDFEQNTAVKGSAIYVGNNSRYVSVTVSVFSKNDIKNNKGENAELEGGVIYVNANDAEATLDISLSNFESNSNKDVDGGVICLDGTSNANIDTCMFKDNKGKVGSVILVKNPNNEKLRLFIESSVFANNSATRGAIATSPKVTAFLDECVFADNTGEYRNIYSNGFTVAHDSTFDVKNAELNARNVKYGESSVISGKADTGTNLYAAANLTVAGENIIVEIKDNAFTYNTDILNSGKHHAVLNGIVDYNNNTYVMDSITKIFRVNKATIDLNVSVDNITYGETVKVTETLPANVNGTIGYYLNGVYYTKEELESLKLDAGKYTLVAYYTHEDYEPAYSLVDFEVNKANAIISVADVEVEAGESIIVNIEANAPSIYTIEIGDYKLVTLINGSKSIEVDKTFAPGTYTIKVTSKERVNYISSSTEAVLKVNEPEQTLVTSLSTSQSPIDEIVLNTLGANNFKLNSQDDLLIAANDEMLSDDESIFDDYEETGNFIYQEDEDDDPQYFDTLEEAIDEASLMGGIITVRGGTYNGWGFCGIDIEGELEITIRAYPGEEVIFDCEGENYFLHLTYDTEVEVIETVPPIPIVYTTEGPTITLENITVINGYNSEGGAIELVAGTLTMTGCNFYNNFAEDYGGAICIGSMNSDQDATLIALNCTFIGNIAGEEGGAIYIEADLEQYSSATFGFCTFLDNFQGEEGSRTRNYFAGTEIEEIKAQYCLFDGTGEIYSLDIDKIEQIVTVNGTSKDSFDSVVLLYNNTLPLYTVYNNGSQNFYITFEDVIGGNYTLGVMNDHDFNTYIFGEPFEVKVANFFTSPDDVFENLTDAIEAVEENGIIYANFNYHIEENMEIEITKSFTIKNYKERMVIFDGNATQWFFTVAEGCNVVFEGINFTDGGMKDHASFENKGTLTFKNCIFTDFETEAIIYNAGFLNISGCEFSDNVINNAIVLNEGELSVDSTVFAGNIINANSVIFNNGNADVISTNFTENINYGNGGAIYSSGSLNIKDSVFRENEGINGGAVYSTGILQVINSTFEDNTANGYGGAIYSENELEVFNSTFTGDYAENDGGTIYNNNIAIVNNSTFVANTANGKGGAIYNNKTLKLTESVFGINYADEFANIYNAGDIQFSENIFDFYDVILHIPDGEYGVPVVITGTLDPQFNMDVQLILPGFVNNTDATVDIVEGIFEHNVGVMPKGIYDVILNEIIYDSNGNVYYGEAVIDRLIVHKANVYINLTVEDIVLRDALVAAPVLKVNATKDGIINLLFNNKFLTVNITDSYGEITLESVGEGNYTVFAVREGDENYNDAVNTTTFKVTDYEGNFVVNSTGHKFDTLREAIADASDDDIIYVKEGNYTGADNLGVTVSGKKLTITSLGVVVFDGNSTGLEFLYINKTSDVTLEDIILTGFNSEYAIIDNEGNLTVNECVFVNNTNCDSLIGSYGNLTISESEFHDNIQAGYFIYTISGSVIINESTFENNIVTNVGNLISINFAKSAKVISNDFVDNKVSGHIIYLSGCRDVLIESVFANNTQGNNAICAEMRSNLLIENSVFTGNELRNIICSRENSNQTIKDCTFTDNTANHVVYSEDEKISVIGSTFSANTVSGNGTLYTTSNDVTIDDCAFTGNKADNYRNIYSVNQNPKITNTTFDAMNVDFTVYDIDYGENETIEGTIDVGTNIDFTIRLNIDSKTYDALVSDNKFTYTLNRPSGGDYTVTVNAQDSNSNTYIFNKVTKTFTVNRVDPKIKVTIPDIVQGENLNVTIFGNRTNHVVYTLNGKSYTKDELENLTLTHGDYLIMATFDGDRNYLPATEMLHVKVNKFPVNIIVNDVVINYGDKINIDVSTDVGDYYTAIIGNETLTYYIRDKVTFAFPALDLKPGSYEILIHVFESKEYAETTANATLTVNKADGFFRIINELIVEGENATVSVKVPIHADGNITYKVYSGDAEVIYNITQSCLEDLVVPNLSAGRYIVTGTYSGDSYYTADSTVNSSIIFVNSPNVDLTLEVSDIIYGEEATVTINCNVDGDYLVWVGDENFTVTVIDGTGNVSVPNLDAGTYYANATLIHDYYIAYSETAFEVAPKPVWVIISVEDIVEGEDAIVNVIGEVDGKYIIKINNQNYTVNVVDGVGNVTVSGLSPAENITASVSIDENNYIGSYNTTFDVASKEVTAIVTVGNIVYGDTAVVIVQANVSGEYIVTLRDVNYTVSVNGGNGVLFVSNLTVGYQIPVTVKRDDRYTAFNETAFNVNPKMVNVELAVENITWTESAIINITAELDGMYTLTVNGDEYLIEVIGGKASKVIAGLVVGDYDAEIVIDDGNYSAFDQAEFNVAPKAVNVSVSVENITYSEEAVVVVKADVDGEYLVYVDDTPYTVIVTDGVANVTVDNLVAGNHVANATVVDSNYSGSDSATFTVAIKPVDVSVSVKNITYEEKAIIIVKADVDGEYQVYVDETPYTAIVQNGIGNVTVDGLTVGTHTANVTVTNGNYSGTDSTTFNVAIKQTNAKVTVENITYEEKAIIIVKADVDGEYLVYVDNTPYTVNVKKGNANLIFDGLTVGTHTANVTVTNGNYSGTDSTTFNVAIKQTNAKVTVENITYGTNANIIIKADVDREYLVYVDNTPYTVHVKNGSASFTVGGLTVGDHAANVTVTDGNYSGTDSTTFNVSKAKSEVDIEFANETTGAPLLEFRLPSDASGNVSVYVNGKLSQVVNLTNGSANILVKDLTVGSNNVTVVYSGDDNYDSMNKSFTVTRKATIEAYDMTRGYNSGLDYTAKLYDANGLPLANANVTIKVDTNTFTVQTDSNGVFNFNNKLAAGDYAIAIVNPVTDEYKLTNLKIVPRITENKDMSIYFADNANYKVRIAGDDGSYVGAGEVVSMNVGGKTYSVKTDKNGYATLKLSLTAKKHTITVTYKGFTTKNKVTVKSIVKPVKKTVKVKKTAKKLKIKVKLKGKKVLKKKRVYLKFKGKTYKAKTNKKGIATFKVPKKVIKKLKKGKKYKATFTYKAKVNGKTLKNTAKCYVKAR